MYRVKFKMNVFIIKKAKVISLVTKFFYRHLSTKTRILHTPENANFRVPF